MKSRDLAAWVVATTIAASPSAFGAPGEQALVTKYKSARSVVTAQAEADAFVYLLLAQNWDDMDGVQQGSIAVQKFGFDTVTQSYTYSYVTCLGPDFANTVTVNKSSGVASVNVLLDPAAAGCTGSDTTALSIALSGVPTGGFSRSDSGSSTFYYTGAIEKASFQSFGFDEDFTGSIGYYTGALTGNAETARITNRTRVK